MRQDSLEDQTLAYFQSFQRPKDVLASWPLSKRASPCPTSSSHLSQNHSPPLKPRLKRSGHPLGFPDEVSLRSLLCDPWQFPIGGELTHNPLPGLLRCKNYWR